MVSMSAELYIVMLGIIKMGGIAVFVDPWISFKSISAFSAFAEPTAFIGVGKSHLLRLFQRNLRTLPITITTGMSYCGIPAKFSLPKLLCNHSGDGEINDVDPDSTALITFTSGSSGTPKGANRTHRFLNAQYAALSHEFPYNDADVDMPMFPVFALSNLARGITSVIPDMDFRKVAEVNPTAISKQMEKHGVTTCTASPPFFDRLSGYLRERDDEPVELRRILTGGAPVDTDQLQQWQSAFENTSIEVVYGSTEAEPVAHIGAARRLELSRQVETKNRGFCTGRPTSLLHSFTASVGRDRTAPRRRGRTARLRRPRLPRLLQEPSGTAREQGRRPERASLASHGRHRLHGPRRRILVGRPPSFNDCSQ
jgi:acyl-coenzyme A synthetase/AMP-(fatty) acid ligase